MLRAFSVVMLGLALPAQAAVPSATYTAQVDSLEVSAGMPFALNLTITVDGNTGLEDMTLPEVGSLRILGNNRSEGTTVQLGGGAPVFRRTVRVTLTLVSEKSGTFSIGKGKVTVGGKTVESAPLSIKVLPQGSVAQRVPQPPSRMPQQQAPTPSPIAEDGDGPDEPLPDAALMSTRLRASATMLKSGLFALLEPDKERVTLGEQVVLTIRILSRSDLSDIDSLRLPKLDGFWMEELENPRRIAPTMVMVEGQRWQSYLLRKIAIFPTKSGEFDIAAVEADVTSGGSFFNAGRRHRVTSLPLKLTVEPLPAQGQPPNFSPGNVGVFQLDVTADRTAISMSQPTTVTVRVRGRGNLRQLAVPRVTETADVRVYDPSPSEDIQVRNEGFEGHKTLEFLVQPRRTGRIELPLVTFGFFNPDAHKYVTLHGPKVVLDVRDDGAGNSASGGAHTNVLGAQARPMRTDVPVDGVLPMLRGSPKTGLLVGGPLLTALSCLFLGSTLRRRREDRLRDTGAQAADAIRALQAMANSGGGVDALRAPLLKYFSVRLGPTVPGMTREELRAAVGTRGLPVDDVERLVRLLDDLDAAAYAPKTGAQRAALADEAVAVVRAVEAALRGQR